MTPRWGIDQPRLIAFTATSAGIAVFLALELPLPFLIGPMAACLIAGLAGMRMRGMGALGDAMRTILGVAVGASITPELLSELPRMAASLALVPAYLVLAGLAGYPLLRRAFGFDQPTAWYGAMPGGLQDMLIFGEEAGGNPRALSLIHATRVLLIVIVAPPLLWAVGGVDFHTPPGQPASTTPPVQVLLMLAAGLGGWRIARRVGLFGASILGPMFAAAALSLGGLITMRPPAEAIWAAQVFIGLAVGVRYSGLAWHELRHDVAAGAALSLMLAVLTLVFAATVYSLGLAPQLEAFLAFAPGGQAEMAVLALLAGADLAFVVSHHVTRIVLVIALSPLILKLMKGRRR
ncbi:AbrB family transcriptional regulator [Pararhodobacter sp. SW119]|uniref:AbrB family transcriptional regulator n=1 Tax=Pararhodobacter sp. SW119 TaxID=2780075 RepID=UPI001FD7F312|nr:AbrB family transcriptional regulator [Pararhodobacter sp. SW119]